MTWSKDLYPGQEHCKYEQAHSIWHEVQASALVDLLYFSNHLNTIIIKYVKN